MCASFFFLASSVSLAGDNNGAGEYHAKPCEASCALTVCSTLKCIKSYDDETYFISGDGLIHFLSVCVCVYAHKPHWYQPAGLSAPLSALLVLF